jgi:hypothetical protein
MATTLDKPITRLSTVIIDGREILVTLTEKQEITLRPKGLSTGKLSISIGDLYAELAAQDTTKKPAQAKKKAPIPAPQFNDAMVSVAELRHLNAVTHSPYEVTTKLDEILVEVMKRIKSNI